MVGGAKESENDGELRDIVQVSGLRCADHSKTRWPDQDAEFGWKRRVLERYFDQRNDDANGIRSRPTTRR